MLNVSGAPHVPASLGPGHWRRWLSLPQELHWYEK